MSARPLLGLMYIVQGLNDLGVDTAPVLRKFGLDASNMDPAAEIDRALELQILDQLATPLTDPAIGLRVGQAYGLAGYGPFVMLLMTCTNAYEAFVTGVKYQRLTFLFGELSFEPGVSESALVLRHAGLPPGSRRFRIDGEASGTLKLLRDLQASLGVDVYPERVEMPYAAPAEAAFYEEFFHCPVVFGSDAIRFWVRNEYLGIRFPTADVTAHRMYEAQCDQLLVRRSQSPPRLAERIRSHLALFAGSYPAAAEVASAFGLSERSFRRQLGDAQTSFRVLLEEVRFARARALLEQTDEPVERVAQRMGYAEPASFIRAFRRWSGTAPARYRRKRRQQMRDQGA